MKLLSDLVENPEWIGIGKIVKAHGLKGAVKVFANGASEAVFSPEGRLAAVDRNGAMETLTVRSVEPGGNLLRVAFAGIEDREQAEKLVGQTLFIEKRLLPALEAGTYYWFELVGMDVFTTGEEYLGTIDSIIPTGGNDVYVVKNGDSEVLIPALEWVVLSVDVQNRTMRVELPEGLR